MYHYWNNPHIISSLKFLDIFGRAGLLCAAPLVTGGYAAGAGAPGMLPRGARPLPRNSYYNEFSVQTNTDQCRQPA